MKAGFGMVLIASLGSACPSAWAQSKDECDAHVAAAIKMLEIRSVMRGAPQKHGDLSIADIQNLQKSKGSCEASKEINKRTKDGAEVELY